MKGAALLAVLLWQAAAANEPNSSAPSRVAAIPASAP